MKQDKHLSRFYALWTVDDCTLDIVADSGDETLLLKRKKMKKTKQRAHVMDHVFARNCNYCVKCGRTIAKSEWFKLCRGKKDFSELNVLLNKPLDREQ